MRLIDADALVEDIRKNSASYFADDFGHEWVDVQPTIDAVPVKHGTPVKHFETWLNSDLEPVKTVWIGYECPFCGDTGIKNYCPNCGARMDGEQDGL